ncbi:5-formyltetrahydrofolate cyclo-ligase [Aestuariimicrobium soli]|uniref:5-formyltetrahydrofolate cyclo-ligase n=1 Tax=Aestuariimicrobium soli TaxID=2035834 RepID=UPI003EBD7E7C
MTTPDPPSTDPDLQSVRLSKQLLRQASRSRRATVSDEARAAADRARSRLVWNALAPGDRVASYLSKAPEPDTLALTRVLVEAGRPVLVPVLRGGGGEPDWTLLRSMDDLRPGPLGIPQPATTGLGADALGHADVILVSGLAGTLDGGRLGVGGGWFDRALVHARPDARVVLMLNESELCAELPLERHDRRVRTIATEERLISCW